MDFQPISQNELSSSGQQPGRSQAMSGEQFQSYAAQGQSTLEGLRQGNPQKEVFGLRNDVYLPPGTKSSFPSAVHDAYNATRAPWGGATISPQSGKPIANPGSDAYAVTTRTPGQQTVTAPANLSEEQFGQHMAMARRTFRPQLKAGDNLGVFHDADAGQIHFDPSTVVHGEQAAQQVAAATHNVGGAYHFESGNGVFPPHVEQ